MFDFDAGWDVGQEAENLTKSLFGGGKKKRKQKASRVNCNMTADVTFDSDDETLTKKEVKRLKKKRQKLKKRDSEPGDSSHLETSAHLPNVNHWKQEGLQPKATKDVYFGVLEKPSRKSKLKMVTVETAVKKSSVKRKRETSDPADCGGLSGGGERKRKIQKISTDASSTALETSDATEETSGKKRKRNRKKKNNSKKNKYAHLALNKQVEQKVEKEGRTADAADFGKPATLKVNGVTPKTHSVSASSNKTLKKTKNSTLKPGKADSSKPPSQQISFVEIETGSSAQTLTSVSAKGKVNATKVNISRDRDVMLESGDAKFVDSVTMKKKRSNSSENTRAVKSMKMKGTEQSREKDKKLNSAPKLQANDISSKGSKPVGQNGLSKNKLHKGDPVVSDNSVQTPAKVRHDVDPQQLGKLQQRQKKLQGMAVISPANSKGGSSEKKKNKKKEKVKNQENGDTETLDEEDYQSQQNTNSKNTSTVKKQTKSPVKAKSDPGPASHKYRPESSDVTSDGQRSSIWGTKTTSLGSQAREKLNAARFRYLNEQLYTCQGSEAMQMFREDREVFKVYHTGFENQASKWPVNPVTILVKQLKDKSPDLVLADFGCGDAKLAQALPQKVHSFDLVALNPRVTACDMTKVPLSNESVDIAVFCLSLMGTNLDDYIHEANRVLKMGGLLKIVEVVSRFRGLSTFLAGVCNHGFQLLNKRDLNQMFYLMDFKKVKVVKKTAVTKSLSLKPCVYKRR